MVKVRREAPDQRLHHRLTAPLWVDTPEGTFKALDWSLGGVGLENYPGKVKVGDILSCAFRLPFQGFDVSFSADIEIKHANTKGRVGAAFKDLGERETELLSHFANNLVRGAMVGVDDTILRIDMPVTPVSTKPDPNPNSDVPVRRRSFKLILHSVFYGLLGMAILIYLGLLLQTNLLQLEVDSAVVTAPIQPLYASSDGRIVKVSIDPFVEVEPDAPLIVIEDPALRRAIEMAEISVNRATVVLIAKQKMLDAENARTRDYRMIALSQLEQINAKVRALETQVQLALQQVENLSDGTATTELNQAQSNYAALQGELETSLQLQRERTLLIQDMSAGHFYSGSKLEGRLAELQANVDLHWEQVRFAKDELLALERQRDRLVLSAPSSGQLVKLLVPRGTHVKRGERVALFERDEARTIDAFLTQEEILQVGLGDHAEIFFPSLGRKVEAIVLDVDRTAGFIDEVNSQYLWRGPKDRSAKVSLGFINIPDAVVRQIYAPGTPAIVIFKRNRSGIPQKLAAPQYSAPEVKQTPTSVQSKLGVPI